MLTRSILKILTFIHSYVKNVKQNYSSREETFKTVYHIKKYMTGMADLRLASIVYMWLASC